MAVNKQSGQALLVVVLVMVVALTVGLSLTSRSIVNIRTSTEEANSQQAIAAAEAGIEKALLATDTTPISGTFIESDTGYETEIKKVEGDSFLANGGNLVLQDEGIDVWLVSHNNVDGKPIYDVPWSGNKLRIYWGDPSLGDCSNAAIEIAVISGSIALPVLKRYTFDPCTERRVGNKFNNPGGGVPFTVTIDGEERKFLYRKEIEGLSSGLVARVVPIYASTAMAIDGNGVSLPTQGFVIDSTGTSGAGNREVKRSITFFKTFYQLGTAYFMYGLFSPYEL